MKIGVQKLWNQLKKLDSGFRRNDKKWCFSSFYEFINIEYLRNSFHYKKTIIKMTETQIFNSQ
jgi:hypothetical protein